MHPMCKLHRRKTSSAHHQRHHDQHVKVIDEEAVRGWKMGWNELQNIICILQYSVKLTDLELDAELELIINECAYASCPNLRRVAIPLNGV
eukprot:scaffold19697_cov172-Skeletonema_dohrnii-CCMP3373.AAC.1